MLSKPPLFFDPQREAYYDVVMGEKYLLFGAKDEFEQLKQIVQDRMEEEEKRKDAEDVEKMLDDYRKQSIYHPDDSEELPIYHYPKKNKYYYPVIALSETEPIPRPIVNAKPPLKKICKPPRLMHTQFGVEYFKFNTPGEFHKLRNETPKLTIEEFERKLAADTPIYRNPKDANYFYPFVALTEKLVLERRIIDEKPPMKKFKDKYIHKSKCHIYVKFQNRKEFEEKRREIQREEKDEVIEDIVPAKLPDFDKVEGFEFPVVDGVPTADDEFKPTKDGVVLDKVRNDKKFTNAQPILASRHLLSKFGF